MAILLHASIDAFGFAAVMTGGLLPVPILLKSSYLATLIGSGAVALLLIIVTRGRLGFSPFVRADFPGGSLSQRD